jgi:hypothetical protein
VGGGGGISIGALSNEYRIVGEFEVWELQWNVLKHWSPRILLLAPPALCIPCCPSVGKDSDNGSIRACFCHNLMKMKNSCTVNTSISTKQISPKGRINLE